MPQLTVGTPVLFNGRKLQVNSYSESRDQYYIGTSEENVSLERETAFTVLPEGITPINMSADGKTVWANYSGGRELICTAKDEETAIRIAQACNSHDGLIKALSSLMDVAANIETQGKNLPIVIKESRDQIWKATTP